MIKIRFLEKKIRGFEKKYDFLGKNQIIDMHDKIFFLNRFSKCLKILVSKALLPHFFFEEFFS
jgi:hypothetical protein